MGEDFVATRTITQKKLIFPTSEGKEGFLEWGFPFPPFVSLKSFRDIIR
jgi:hypothetical protein